ncbi:MAG: LPS export ABC transporter periplasmic protein LptC [Acinetobacter populi]|jgi:lipopolysaccharide export system protein LptC|uniref:LPS export ABC transporter periplasmic protein LptC n=1 Tax=Acinetobacter populi TaxID=1582270 RepID=UPI002352C1EA|nr:LPS export ABC transporter periplasmic protein LptC [Acinetobacter populi]MCH4247355.1 LPS export ABC transporter periplasmic protein LptC [Acinetobacter populi]
MDTRLLYTIALVIVTVVGGFYYYSGKSKKLETAGSQNLNSTADNIQVVQTNEHGQLYAKASAKHMTQWMQTGRAEIEQIQGMLYEAGLPSATFHADKSIATNDYANIEMLGNVTISRLAADNNPSVTFKTDRLLGLTKNNTIETDRPVQVTSPQAQFTSQGLKANLSTGQYELFALRGKYAPSSP